MDQTVATQEYKKAQTKYETALADKKKAEVKLESCTADLKRYSGQLSDCKNQKHDLEKRLAEVKSILKVFTGTVTHCISDSNRSAQQTQSLYEKSIHCTGISSASIETAYATDSMESPGHLNSAYQACVHEKERLEQDIQEIAASIKRLDDAVGTLNSGIASSKNAIAACNSTIRNSSNQMVYYSRYK